jgi:branched-chain amino acid transport system substrate-binding protein
MTRTTLFVAIFGLGSFAYGAPTVKLVAEMPLSQPFTPIPQSIVNAVHMAVDDAGDAVCGGAFGVAVQANDESSPGTFTDPTVVAANAAADVADTSILGIVGTLTSDAATILIPGVNPAQLAMVSPSNTYPGLTKPGLGISPAEPGIYYPNGIRNYARVIPTDDIQGAQGATWAQQLGVRSVYIVDDGGIYGATLARFFEAAAIADRLSVLGHVTMGNPLGGANGTLNSQILRTALEVTVGILQARPDLVYYAGEGFGAVSLFTQLRQDHYTGVFMGGDALQDQGFVDALGADVAAGIYATVPGLWAPALGSGASAWIGRYETIFGVPPETFALNGYVSAQVLLAALNASCASLGTANARAAVRAAMMGTSNFASLLGTFSFDADGDTTSRGTAVFQVQNGHFVFVANLQ